VLDIGFSELLLIAGIGLVVLGPQRLPVVTRTVGTLLGRAQKYVSDVKTDIQRQMELEELRKVKDTVTNLGETIASEASKFESEANAVASDVSSSFESDRDFQSVYDQRAGLYIGSPSRSWAQEQADNRLRDRLRARLRKRYLVKRPKD
jgi:sec-independent protein translocase protein TatB